MSCWESMTMVVALEPKDAAVPGRYCWHGVHCTGCMANSMCVLSKENEVQCWGTNVNGQLGNGGKTLVGSHPVVGLP